MRLCGESRKRFGLAAALWPWGCGLRCCRAHGGGVAWPRPLEHEAQPHQGDQHQLVKKEMGYHGNTPSYRWRNEGILPGFSGYRMSRRLQGHDRLCYHLDTVVYDLFREFSQPTLKHRSLFCCLSSREQIPERLTALLTLKHPDVPLLAPHLLMKALQEVRRPDEPPERLGKRDRQVG